MTLKDERTAYSGNVVTSCENVISLNSENVSSWT